MNQEIINNALDNWDFDIARVLKRQRAEIDFHFYPDYCKYLADTGNLDELKDVIKSIEDNQYLYLSVSLLPDFNIVTYLKHVDLKLSRQKNEDFFAQLYVVAQNKNYKELENFLKTRFKSCVRSDISAEYNMVLNFAYNILVKSRLLDVDLASNFIEHIFHAKNLNNTRKRYLIKTIVDYFYQNSDLKIRFFKLREQYYNHIQKLISLIHAESNDGCGARFTMDKLFVLLRYTNNLSLYLDSVPKVAICVSGMMRGNSVGLESIFTNLVKPLNADIFMHTWNLQQDWIGGARSNDRFWFRTFNFNETKIPKNLLNLNFLGDIYPCVFHSLMTPVFSELSSKSLKEKFNFKELFIENQDEFMKEFSINDSYISRGSYNQIKMFYGMYKVFSLVINHEMEKNIKYDYIIKVRPDLIIKKGISFNDLNELENNELAVPTGFYGIQDMIFYSRRNVYMQVISIFEKIIESKRLSPFRFFPKYDAHALMLAWMIYNDIKPVLCNIKYNIEEGVSGLKIPNLKEALSTDCNVQNYSRYPEETQWLEKFLKEKAK